MHDVKALFDRRKVSQTIAANTPGLAFGNGRSYGDVGLNPGGVLWTTRGLDRFIGFDADTGILTCEAGVLLRDITRAMLPQGWGLPVTPGTELITVGGAIANDIHGKNHHRLGSFGDHVRGLRLVRTDGQEIVCSATDNPDWLAATIGGMGLTGVIVDVDLSLRRTTGPWQDTETIVYNDLDEFFLLADASEAAWEHTVSWIDCISGGRGLFMRGNPVSVLGRFEPHPHKIAVPLTPPISLVNGLSLRVFNEAYFRLQKARAGRKICHYAPFFYPLDNVLEWNRIYGPKGFYQYQSVVPRENGRDAVQEMLLTIAKSGDGSFLAVLKTFGNRESKGLMSFPQPGVTLALDFPNKGARTAKLFERLDSIVLEAKGRLYPAKDARMPRKMFEKGYPRLKEFLRYRDLGIRSGLSRRLMEE